MAKNVRRLIDFVDCEQPQKAGFAGLCFQIRFGVIKLYLPIHCTFAMAAAC